MDYTTTAAGATETPCTTCGAPAIGCMWTIGNKTNELITVTSVDDPRVTVEYYCAEHEPKEPEATPSPAGILSRIRAAVRWVLYPGWMR